jgi:hypothetical protein
MAYTPYHLYARAQVCACVLPAQPYGRFRDLNRAITHATGYLAVHNGFYGTQVPWLHWEIIDVRTGQVVWRDGQPTGRTDDGTLIAR